MSVLAFKAIGYGAEQIPDKFFEKLPGGYFCPPEKKKSSNSNQKDGERARSDQRSKRSSRRDGSPQTEYTDSAYDDTDYERERDRSKKDRSRRAKSEGRKASPGRGRDSRRSGFDGEYSDSSNMARAEQGSPYFPPPPASEYAPYNPQDYASQPAQGDYRPSSAGQPYGYPPQVNNSFRSHSATFPSMAAPSTPTFASPSMRSSMSSRPPSHMSTPSPIHHLPFLNSLSRGSPVSASFSPSYEPPLAALLHRPFTNTPKPAAQSGYSQQHRSSTAARYTPGPGYAPSPVPVGAPIPPPPVGVNSPAFVPYNPADYPGSAGYQAANSAYPSPPPLNRNRSNSNPPYPSHNSDQRLTAYDEGRSSSRRDSTKPRREHRHRARSADTQASRKDDRHRENSRMAKVRDRFDSMDLRGEGLAAAVGGALAGGFAGRQLGRGKLTTLAGAAAGALGGKAISDRRSKSRGKNRSPSRDRSRSRSRHRHHGDRARSRDRSYSRSPPRGLRARSRSIIDRFRSKSRGPPEEREVIHIEKRRERPDRGYDRERSRSRSRSRSLDRDRSRDRARGGAEEYEYFSSESETDGSPVTTRRRRRRSRRAGDY